MSLPKPPGPTTSVLNTSKKHVQFHQHLPSPIKPHFLNKTSSKHNEEKKHNDRHCNNTHATIYPKVFNPKFNTNDIDWNELHYIAVEKGRIIFVENIIKTHYASYLTNYTPSNKHNLPRIPKLSPKILIFIRQIISDIHMVQRARTLINSHSNWETQVDNYDNISVYYRKERYTHTANDIHSIKISFSSKCHPVDFLAVINEFDLMKEVVTIVPLETKYLKEWTNLNKVIYGKVHMWWPLRHRDAIVHVRAYDLLSEHDEVVICGKSCDEIKIDGVNMPPVDKKTLRVDVRTGQGCIKPILMDNGEIGTKVTAVMNVDFKTVLPKPLINWITRTFAYYACKMIRERTENLNGTTHQQRVKEKEIYHEYHRNFMEWKTRKLAHK